MSREYQLQLEDILLAITKIREYVGDMSFDVFEADGKTQDAVIRNLEVIGEAARSLPDDVKAMSTTVDWRKIIGLRNLLIHEYFGVSLDIVWDVATRKLDGLEVECVRLNSFA